MSRIAQKIAEFYGKATYFRQVGLYHDDIIKRNYYEKGVLKEAVRRMPLELREQRNLRLERALQLSAKKEILPKEEWSKPGQHQFYLEPYIASVVRDIETRRHWDQYGKIPEWEGNQEMGNEWREKIKKQYSGNQE